MFHYENKDLSRPQRHDLPQQLPDRVMLTPICTKGAEYAAGCRRMDDHDVSAAGRFPEAAVDDADPA